MPPPAYAPRTYVLDFLPNIFNWAIKRDYAEKNPAAKVEPYSVRGDFGVAEVEAVRAHLDAEIAAASGEHRYVLEILRDAREAIWWSTMRVGEVCRLRREDFNFERGEYAVRSATNKGPRLEPMTPEMKAVFERRLAVAKKNLVFSSMEGEDAYNTLQQAWGRFLKRHPKHQPYGFHALRHRGSWP